MQRVETNRSMLTAALDVGGRLLRYRIHGASVVLATMMDFRNPSAQRRPVILVIDDDPEMRAMLEETLVGAGYRIIVASSGMDGARRFRSGPSDLVILDVFMHTRDGLETLMEIRRHTPAAKVLMISGGGRLKWKEALVWAERLGASATLAKPFTPAELLSIVSKVLGKERIEPD